MAVRKQWRQRHLHLEDYSSFFHFRNADDFTFSQLNQILHMHGFSKCCRDKRRKAEQLKALSEVDEDYFLEPYRSTLNESVFPRNFSCLTIDEVKADLETLEWQEECPVQSLQSLSSANGDEVHHDNGDNGDDHGSIEKKRRKRVRKVKEKMRKVFEPLHLTKPRSMKNRLKRKRIDEIGISTSLA